MIDTHSHLDVEDFFDDLPEVISRSKQEKVEKVFIPAINITSCKSVLKVANEYNGYAYAMLGLHPEEVKDDYLEQLLQIKTLLDNELIKKSPVIAIGEIGLDFYWSREFEKFQLNAFRKQVEWSVETRLPLIIHCRKAQNEMVHILNDYSKDLPGGIFHCFTGNENEAEQLLKFNNFYLGIGGVLTFKNSKLPEVLAKNVPLGRIVLETDSPYMAPVPMRGKRNESSYVKFVTEKLAEVYNVSKDYVDTITTSNVFRIVNIR